MLLLTCKHHKNLRWLVKDIAWGPNGYNGCRNLHYIGGITDPAKIDSRDCSDAHSVDDKGYLVQECKCPISDLVKLD
jgi:hypothetical protein